MHEAPRVKICGLTRRDDVLAAEAAGADYVGVVLSAGFARSVEPAGAASLVAGVAPASVAVLVDESVAGAAARGRALGARVLQLHGEEPPETVRALRAEGAWRIWKAVRCRAPADVERALERFGALVDGVVVEGFCEGVVGGGGARLDPELLAHVRASVPAGTTFVLAGGLTPANVAEAVAEAAPDVVDVSSGVEDAPGRKDPHRIVDFVRATRGDTLRPAPGG